jgi:hypothetical protein
LRREALSRRYNRDAVLRQRMPRRRLRHPSLATAPNQCDNGSGDCVPDPGTPSPNDHVCSSGPFEQFCGPAETFVAASSMATRSRATPAASAVSVIATTTGSPATSSHRAATRIHSRRIKPIRRSPRCSASGRRRRLR